MKEAKESKDKKGQLESVLADIGRKIDQLIAETKGATADVRGDIEKKAEELRKKRDKLEEEVRAYRDKNEPKWKEAREHLNSAAGEVKKALDTLFQKKKES